MHASLSLSEDTEQDFITTLSDTNKLLTHLLQIVEVHPKISLGPLPTNVSLVAIMATLVTIIPKVVQLYHAVTG